MTAKIVIIAETPKIEAALGTYGSNHSYCSGVDSNRSICVIYPRHHHARFALADEPGVTVMPGMHDPTPIGATVAAALAHVNAKPTETMREVALRLHEKHGSAFHPDT